MTLEELAYLAQIVGVILVIASLMYVARQLRQNTAAILAQSRQSVLAAAQAELFFKAEPGRPRKPDQVRRPHARGASQVS
jgi:hypothetical protein